MKMYLLVSILMLAANAYSGIFVPNFDASQPYVIVEGRASFSKAPYWMVDKKDELAFFYDGVCVSSTNRVNSLVSSHYDLMYINVKFLDISHLTAKVFKYSTGTIWDSSIMSNITSGNYYGRDYHIDIQAKYDTNTIPEPSVLYFLLLGILGVKKYSIK